MNIKEIRLKTNMTQREFAECLNIPQRTIENWEGGQRTPPEYVIELIKYKIKKEDKSMLMNKERMEELKLRLAGKELSQESIDQLEVKQNNI